jgi:hypothetical protein
MYVYTIHTRPLSVQAQYSRSCPIISCSWYNGSQLTNHLGFPYRLATDHAGNTLNCCVRLGEGMFSVRCTAISKPWTYREHCFYCYVTCHVTTTQTAHWSAGRCPATRHKHSSHSSLRWSNPSQYVQRLGVYVVITPTHFYFSPILPLKLRIFQYEDYANHQIITLVSLNIWR